MSQEFAVVAAKRGPGGKAVTQRNEHVGTRGLPPTKPLKDLFLWGGVLGLPELLAHHNVIGIDLRHIDTGASEPILREEGYVEDVDIVARI